MKKAISLSVVLIFTPMMYSVEDTTNAALYLGLSTEFWDLDKPTLPAGQYAFFRKYIAQSPGPILEPMCGTGRILIPLLEEGFDVEGFDASPFMFKELQRKCKEKKLSPRIWEQYLEQVPETKQYELIILPDTSFTVFTDPQFIKKSLQKIYSLLKPGGMFVFDVQTIHARWGEIGIWTGKAHKRPDGTILVESCLPLPIENSISPLLSRFELMDKTKVLKTEIEHYQAKLYHPTEMDSLLEEVGFKKIKRIKAYDQHRKPSDNDEVIVYECVK